MTYLYLPTPGNVFYAIRTVALLSKGRESPLYPSPPTSRFHLLPENLVEIPRPRVSYRGELGADGESEVEESRVEAYILVLDAIRHHSRICSISLIRKTLSVTVIQLRVKVTWLRESCSSSL